MSGSGYALAVLFAINLMNFFDRQIIGGVGEGIRREWALSDTALGLLGTVFTLLYAVVGLPLGRLSDRMERRKILAAGVFVWSLLTAVSGMARNFSQLIVARLGVGVGEATCSPASTSLIGDLVRADHARARAIAIWMLGLPLGLGLANGAGGWILQNWGWRNAFYVAAVPGHPVRGRGADDARADARHARSSTRSARGGAPAIRTCSCSRFRRCCGSSCRARCTTSTCTRSARSSRRSSSAFTT